jgi:hypothetical protein
VVLVAEDTLNEAEGADVYPALREAVAYTPGASTLGSKIVVGVASIDVKPGSSYIGLFQPPCELINTQFRAQLEADQAKAPRISQNSVPFRPTSSVTSVTSEFARITKPPLQPKLGM